MPKSIQKYIAGITEKAAADLIAAARETPEERRDWSPLDKGRSVVDQVAECALLGGYTGKVLADKAWPATAFDAYAEEKAALAENWSTASAALTERLPGLLAAIESLSDEDLDVELSTPFGPMTLEQIATYPYWNMTYHQGQVTYVGILS